MISALVLYLLVSFATFYLGIRIVQHANTFRQILRIPAPRRHPILGNMIDVSRDEVGLFKDFRRWAKNLPNGFALYMYPLYVVNIFKPEDVEILIASTKHSKKSIIYRIPELWLGNGLLTSSGKTWHTHRKLLTPAFHFNILQEFVNMFHSETKRLLDVLETISEKQDIDIVPIISLCALHIIKRTSMGSTLDSNENENKEYEEALLEISKVYIKRLLRPWLYIREIYYYFSSLGKRESKLTDTLHSFTEKVINNRRKKLKLSEVSRKRGMVMLDLLLAAENEGEIDLRGIRDEINTFMFEGHDTTAMSISFSLMLFALHKNVQDDIVREINEILPDPSEEPTIAKLNQLKYLDRCIKESLRLFPSVWIISRVADEDIVTSRNIFIPNGCIVNVLIFDLHRDPEHFPHPEQFDPDRFLPENSANRHPFAYIPFSAGPRNCIGQKFAMLEMKTVLCGILRKFIVQPISTPETLDLCAEILLRPKNGVHIKLVKRNI